MSTPDDLHFDPDDPRLTAYALGELPDAADRARVEALLAASSEARAELADIRSLTAALTAEYEQDRLAADTAPTPMPANVIRLPDQRRAWLRPLLAVAAVLLLAGFLTVLMLPTFSSVQVRNSRHVGQLARPADDTPAAALAAKPAESAKAFAFDAKLARDNPSLSAKITLDQPTPAPALAMLAAATPAAAPISLAAQSPPVVAGQTALTRSKDVFYGANVANGGALLADASKIPTSPPETTEADRVVVTGSNIPTSEEVAPAPAVPMLSQSEAMAPRQVVRASSLPAGAAGKTANAKRAEASATATGNVDFANQPSGPAVFALRKGKAAAAPATQDVDTRADVLSVLTRSTSVISSGGGGIVGGMVPEETPVDRPGVHALSTAAYDHIAETPFLAAKENPLSTFSVDVDTASYSIVRRFIEQGSLPPPDAVRIEEMLNYFPYDYAPPTPGDEHPFAVHLEGAACPWNPDHRLVRVALKGREIARDNRPPSNLVFLLDVSGSMEPAERLPLIKESLRLLVEKLTDNDRVAIVVYAGNSGLALPSTNGAHKDTILHALDHLEAGGSTNGASGIKLAYKVAQENFLKGGTNRVILATDGDFNVGTTSQGELVRLIEKEARGGVFLSVLGVGTDNLKDATMQKLADHGNGNYAYLDGIAEGKKVLVEQMSGTLVTIAKDVKIQVEFNPIAVSSYRLVGYEKRLLRKEDFNDDRVDAGEIGAGHSVTALYEVIPFGRHDAGAAPAVDALKYGPVAEDRPVRAVAKPGPVDPNELLTVKIRHKAPESDKSERSYEVAFVDHGAANDYANASPDFKFAAAVATFGLALRDSPYRGNATIGAAVELAQESKGADASGYRAGFIELARRAAAIKSR